MVDIPSELVRAIQAGDCVLWAGAGIGDLAGRPAWSELLRRLVDDLEEEQRAPLLDLLEQGRLRTVLSYIHRHHGDDPLANLLKRVAAEGDGKPLAAGCERLAEFRWRAHFATTNADVVWQILSRAGQNLDVISHKDVHDLSLRRYKDPFILRTPPTGRSMRADRVFFELVEEVVKTRTILFIGFDPDDPDLFQIYELLDRIGRGRRHYAWLPYVSDAEAEELLEQRGIEVVHADESAALPEVFGTLLDAVHRESPRPSVADGDLARLDLTRALAGIDVRADFATDMALNFDVAELDALLDALPGHDIKGLDPRTLLRVGAVQLAHGRLDKARRAFQMVVSRGAGPEYEAIARFNLALVTADEGDGAGAVEGLTAALESSRTLATVPPRFAIVDCQGRDHCRLRLTCRDRETQEVLELEVMTLGHTASPAEQRRFYEEVHRLVEVDHPAVQNVRGAFADGRLYGIMSLPQPGYGIGDVLDESSGPVSLERAFEILGPLMEGLDECHRRGVLHRNINLESIVITKKGPLLRGFGAPPVVAFNRPAVRRANVGFAAPELLQGAPASAQADVYSLCAVIYRCIAGRPPVGGVPSPLEANPGLDLRICELLDRGLHPDPSRRPALTKLRTEIARILTTPMPTGTMSVSEQERAQLAQAQARLAELEGSEADLRDRLEETEAELAVAREMAAEAGVDIDEAEHSIRDELAASRQKVAALESELAQLRSGAPTPVSDPGSVPITEPSDPNDLEAWTWILERKPNHLEARQNVERIEREAREGGRWDTVAEVLMVRAQISQVQRDRIELLRELARIFEDELGAPASALETYRTLAEDVTGAARAELADELLRLAAVTGDFADVAPLVLDIAQGSGDAGARVRLRGAVARVYDHELGATDRAIAAWELALEDAGDEPHTLREVADLYRRAGRAAELAATLLTLGEHTAGVARHEAYVEAAELLHGELGEDEGAIEALEVVHAEDPSHERAASLAETLADKLERWPLLASVLEARADHGFDDAQAVGMLRRAAEIRRDKLDDARGAFDDLRRALGLVPDDLEAARMLVDLCRAKGASSPEARESMIDALSVMAESEADDAQKAELLEELAGRLDVETDGAERGAEARRRLVTLVAASDPRGARAIDALIRHLEANPGPDNDRELAEVLERLAADEDLEPARRIDALDQQAQLARERLGDPTAECSALERLVALAPDDARWRDRLLRALIDLGEIERAESIIDEQLAGATDPAEKVGLLLGQARLRMRASDHPGAEARLLDATSLAPEDARVWEALRELYETEDRPLKALDAQIKAAELVAAPVERGRRLFEAVQVLDARTRDDARAVALLTAAVEADPDHREATERLVELLTRQGDLARAWPHSRALVTQVRTRAPEDAAQNLRALSIAGRCALAAGEREQARDYLAKARDLDARDLEVRRLLADLDLDAGAYEDAIKGYQACALGAGDDLDASAQSELYTRMGEAWLGQEENGKAHQMFERAAEVDPDSDEPLRKLLDAARAPQERVRALDRLAALLGTRADASSGESAQVARDEQVELLRQIATVLQEDLGDPGAAAAKLEQIVDARPEDPSVLHQMLDLYTNTKQWTKATDVLGRLAHLQQEVGPRVAYLYAAAVLIRDNVGDKIASAEWMRKVLAADPMHEKAFKAVVQMLEEVGAYKELSRVLRDRLKALPEGADPEIRLTLLSTLGQLYDERLRDRDTALAAYEQALALTKDDERRFELRERMLGIADSAGESQHDRSIALVQQQIQARPTDFERYHRLVDLFDATSNRDGAVCAARALMFVKQANNKEFAIANRGAKGFVQARGTMPRELWKGIMHPLARKQARLSDLFALIWPVLAARLGQTYSMLGVERSQRTPVSIQTPGIQSYLAFACQVFDVPVPELYLRKGEAGGFMVAAPTDGQNIYASIMAGDAALGQQPEEAYAFRCGRAAFRSQPQHMVAELYRGGTGLKDAVWAAIAAAHPKAPVPKDMRERVAPVTADIVKLLPPAHVSHLETVTRKIIEAGSFDAKAWSEGIDYTASRVGYILAGSIETSVRVLSQGAAEGSGIPAKEVLKDLVGFTVSPGYLKVRKALKLSV